MRRTLAAKHQCVNGRFVDSPTHPRIGKILRFLNLQNATSTRFVNKLLLQVAIPGEFDLGPIHTF